MAPLLFENAAFNGESYKKIQKLDFISSESQHEFVIVLTLISCNNRIIFHRLLSFLETDKEQLNGFCPFWDL